MTTYDHRSTLVGLEPDTDPPPAALRPATLTDRELLEQTAERVDALRDDVRAIREETRGLVIWRGHTTAALQGLTRRANEHGQQLDALAGGVGELLRRAREHDERIARAEREARAAREADARSSKTDEAIAALGLRAAEQGIGITIDRRRDDRVARRRLVLGIVAALVALALALAAAAKARLLPTQDHAPAEQAPKGF